MRLWQCPGAGDQETGPKVSYAIFSSWSSTTVQQKVWPSQARRPGDQRPSIGPQTKVKSQTFTSHRKNTQKKHNPATAVPIAKQPQDAKVKGQKQQQQTSSKPSKSSSKASDAAPASGGDAGGEPTADGPGSLAAMEQQEPSRAARTTAAPGLAAPAMGEGGEGEGEGGSAADLAVDGGGGGGGGSSGTGQWTSNFNQGGGGQIGNQQYQAYVLWPAGWQPEPGWDNGGGRYLSDGQYNWYATPWPGSQHQ